jgi:hypothetical protein
MKWLMLLVSVVLGAGITWLLTVKRETRTIGPVLAPEPRPPADESFATSANAMDEAAGFGGPATRAPSSELGWDRTAQDEDALFPHEPHLPAEPVADPGAARLEVTSPIAEATPNGDLAGVAAPRVGADASGPASAPDSPSPHLPGSDEEARADEARADEARADEGDTQDPRGRTRGDDLEGRTRPHA